MLQGIIRKGLRVRFNNLIHQQIKGITSSKILVEKKKQVYQNQVKSLKKKDIPVVATLSEQEKQQRRQLFESCLIELGKDILQYLNFKMGADPKSIDITSLLSRHQQKMLSKLNHLHALELINYVEIVKNLCLSKLEHVENIDTAYKELKSFIQLKEHQNVLQQHFRTLWTKIDIALQYQIRTVGLMEYMPAQTRKQYIHKIVPLVRYFKSTEIQILLFQKWRFNYNYPYELIDQIHRNQYYFSMEDINSSYWKMLFVESIKGQFIGNEDGIYSKILSLFKDKPNILAHAAFHKFVKILQSQGYFVQSESTRQHLENSLNMFINIAKNQNYGQNSMNLSQLVELYLGFEETNATGQTLLSEITFLSKTTNFQMTSQNLPLYQQLLSNVLKNIKPVLKYERIDYLNKQYTYDTINFLNQFLPKYIRLWPEVIFEVNDASHELFSLNAKDNSLIQSFVSTFNSILQSKQTEIGLKNVDFTLKILRFLVTHKRTQLFSIKIACYKTILEDFLRLSRDQPIPDSYLQAVYLSLSLLGQNCIDSTFKPLISRLNRQFIQYFMNEELQNQDKGYIKSFNHNIVWLALINAKIKSHNFAIDESIVQVFVNQRLFFMINSLKYLQVYELLVYVLNLSRLNYEVYSRLVSNLSTFIIYTNQKTTRKHGVTSFFLNHRYMDYYYPICRLVLDNKQIFKKIKDKQSFKVLQIMVVKHLESFSNKDILTFLEILGDPSILNISLNKYIEDIKFTAAELEHFQYSSTLRYFQYYNKSLLRYFQGKYNESQVKKRLKGGSLSSAEIQQFFSKIEVYKTIIMEGDLNIRFELPQPKTNIPDFKYMYACQKIYQKIESQNQFLLQEDEQRGMFSEVNLQNEKDYINRQLLFLEDSQNQFRIENRPLPKYIKMEVWESNIFFDKRCIIDPKDLFLNSKKLTDQILNKIVKGVFGKYEKIRQVLKQFSASEQLLTLLNDQRLKYSQHGAALQFKRDTQSQTSLTIVCTNNTNYKILYICAYYIAKNGSRVIIVKEQEQLQGIISMLKENYPILSQEEQPEKQEEEESES